MSRETFLSNSPLTRKSYDLDDHHRRIGCLRSRRVFPVIGGDSQQRHTRGIGTVEHSPHDVNDPFVVFNQAARENGQLSEHFQYFSYSLQVLLGLDALPPPPPHTHGDTSRTEAKFPLKFHTLIESFFMSHAHRRVSFGGIQKNSTDFGCHRPKRENGHGMLVGALQK